MDSSPDEQAPTTTFILSLSAKFFSMYSLTKFFRPDMPLKETVSDWSFDVIKNAKDVFVRM